MMCRAPLGYYDGFTDICENSEHLTSEICLPFSKKVMDGITHYFYQFFPSDLCSGFEGFE